MPETHAQSRYIGAPTKDLPRLGDVEEILDDLVVVVEVGGQVVGRVAELLPRVVDILRLVV